MKARLGIGLVVAGVLAGGNASAQDRVTYHGSYGLEIHHQDYEESSLNVEEKGWFGGVTAELIAEYNLWQLRLDGRLAYGRMDYKGSGTVHGIDDLVGEGRIAVGYALPFGEASQHRVTPYAGYGYRRLVDYLGGKTTSTGAVGYDRMSQYHYIPMGVELTYRASPEWSFKPTLEYDYLVQGYQDSYIVGDLHNSQDSGYGLRASLMAITSMGGREIEFGPFVRYWNIEQSDISSVVYNGVTILRGYEPANTTVEAGVALKLRF